MVSCFSNEQPLINTSEYFNSGDFFRLGLLERKRIKQEALKFEASLGQTVRPWFKKKIPVLVGRLENWLIICV